MEKEDRVAKGIIDNITSNSYNETKNEYAEYINEKNKDGIWLISTFLLGFIVFVLLVFFAIYGGHHFIKNPKYEVRIANLQKSINLKQKIINIKEKEIKKLNVNLALMHQAQSLENFLMMLLNEDQKKDFKKAEEYCKQFYKEDS